MKQIGEFDARLECLQEVKDFLNDWLGNNLVEQEFFFDLNVAIEEVFTNIVSYGLKRRQADKITIQLEVDAESVQVNIIDPGIAFNPLKEPEPNLDLPLAEREQGGLGIFMIKQLMDEVSYSRVNKRNVLTLRKDLSDNRNIKE